MPKFSDLPVAASIDETDEFGIWDPEDGTTATGFVKRAVVPVVRARILTGHESVGGTTHPVAIASGAAGFLSGADKAKLDGIETGAEANDVDSVFGRTGAVIALASDYDANQIDYDNGTSGLTATEVQAAIDEVVALVDAKTASDIPFTPNGSIAATDVQAAVQEVRDEAAPVRMAVQTVSSSRDVADTDNNTYLDITATSTLSIPNTLTPGTALRGMCTAAGGATLSEKSGAEPTQIISGGAVVTSVALTQYQKFSIFVVTANLIDVVAEA